MKPMVGAYSTERIKISVLILKTLFVLSPFVTINEYLNGRLLTAGVGIVDLVSIPLLLYVSRYPRFRALPMQALLTLLVVTFILHLLFIYTPADQMVWIPLYPVGVYFLGGKRLGTILSAIFTVVLAAHFLLHSWLFHLPIPVYQFGEDMSAFILVTAISFSYEHIRSRQEEDLKKLAELAEAGSRAKSDFLSNMSHEIRTPMNSVLGMAYLALKSEQDPKQRDYLEKIRLSGEHMLGIIDDILDFSKIEAGKLLIDNTDFDLDSLLKKLGSLLSWRANAKGLDLHFDIDPGIPRHLYGDSLRLNQVLLNYVNNAIKFTERGEIVVRARVLEKIDNNYLIRFEVEDTGIGISDEQQAALFHPFHQVDSAATRKFGGTGLGLAISKKLVALMGGSVGVESKPGLGSTFWLNITLRNSDKTAVHLQDNLPANATMPDKPFAIQGSRILVAENNKFNQQVAKEFLENAGACVCIANNGQEVLDILAKEPFDCVLMDVQMPVLDGMEATRLIRANPHMAGIRIIAMTANASREDREKCIAAGMDDFISKPIRPDNLYSTLTQYLSGCPSVSSTAAALPGESVRPDDTAIIDWARMIELFGGEREKSLQFFQRYLTSTRTSMHEADAALQRDDMQALVALVHDMKSTASLVGAMRFWELCVELEKAAISAVEASWTQRVVRQLHIVLEQMEYQVNSQSSFQ